MTDPNALPEYGGSDFHKQTSTPHLRIFLSYGHDSNEELVRQIKRDLEKRGHDVWIDESEIKARDDWRRKITDGIMDSQHVLSFLSNTPHVTPEYALMK